MSKREIKLMIFLVSLTTDLRSEFNHVQRGLASQIDLTSDGPLLFLDFKGTARELMERVSVFAPKNASFFVAALGDWDSMNTRNATQWLGRKQAAP